MWPWMLSLDVNCEVVLYGCNVYGYWAGKLRPCIDMSMKHTNLHNFHGWRRFFALYNWDILISMFVFLFSWTQQYTLLDVFQVLQFQGFQSCLNRATLTVVQTVFQATKMATKASWFQLSMQFHSRFQVTTSLEWQNRVWSLRARNRSATHLASSATDYEKVI